MSDERQARVAMKHDAIWALLWGLTHEGAGATRADVWEAWLDGRPERGCAFYDDWIGPRQTFAYALDRLVKAGRARVDRRRGRQPLYEAVQL